jgi:hypothetical protein
MKTIALRKIFRFTRGSCMIICSSQRGSLSVSRSADFGEFRVAAKRFCPPDKRPMKLPYSLSFGKTALFSLADLCTAIRSLRFV